ncbi:nucleotidyl transferase AbiEii/AbiGii toxin family protein [Geoalkalibacter ferrihydriticus]|nr:nucleotidyl transferase AbiEii/AbiGii toxin family protein [Geoalkalibacter ferrihydriticus]
MKDRKNNMAASVRQRLLNRARERREDFGLLLTRFGTERLLYRLGESEYSGAFILKGAMLFPLWGLDEHRPTRDADLLGFGESTEAHLAEVFRDVCRVEVAGIPRAKRSGRGGDDLRECGRRHRGFPDAGLLRHSRRERVCEDLAEGLAGGAPPLKIPEEPPL